ncbi:hypothetical protein BV898_07032 [Hypsibius exemplaris]|uniref:Uncharacterized protein n=1 Tax=Hypsibius exemplaris TaxID=2072580 RepID=A0A1W0WUZ6_HYPEX|nr:hypothetical protein BV898_07032 [Hypsibius exemplaris]
MVINTLPESQYPPPSKTSAGSGTGPRRPDFPRGPGRFGRGPTLVGGLVALAVGYYAYKTYVMPGPYVPMGRRGIGYDDVGLGPDRGKKLEGKYAKQTQ